MSLQIRASNYNDACTTTFRSDKRVALLAHLSLSLGQSQSVQCVASVPGQSDVPVGRELVAEVTEAAEVDPGGFPCTVGNRCACCSCFGSCSTMATCIACSIMLIYT